jgi:hypothetical protein
MVDLGGLYEVVQIFTDILPIIIILGLVGLVIGFILYMIPTNGKITKKLKGMFIVPMFAFLILSPALAGTAAVGLNIDTNTVFEGTPVTVEASGLTVGTEYTIWASGNDFTMNNITFEASRATEFIVLSTGEDSDNSFTLSIGTSTSGVASSAAATEYVSLRQADDFLPTSFFLSLIAPLIVIGLIVGLAVAILASVVKGKGSKGTL